MRFIINLNSNAKHSIVFIHGYMKSINDFNIGSNNKKILIEERMRKYANTILVHIEHNDYLRDISTVSDEIYQTLMDNNITSVIIVCHSYGAFYGFNLAQRYSVMFRALLLIEPTIKSDHYKKYLQDKSSNSDVDMFKYHNYDKLPDFQFIKPKTIVRIHIDYKHSKGIKNKIESLCKLTNKNIKSRLNLHMNKGHMIHYTAPDVILYSIKEMINTLTK